MERETENELAQEGGPPQTAISSDDFMKTGVNDQILKGRFRYKFQEGHSKNFKRELGFDWFLPEKAK